MTLAAAIKRAYTGRLTQTELAQRLGTDQSRISKWVSGNGPEPSYAELARLEDALGRPRGYVLRAAGYVVDATTTEEAIEADPRINDELKRFLLASLHAAVEQSSNDPATDAPKRRRT